MIYVQGCACHNMHVKISDWLYEEASNKVFCTIFKWNTSEDREFNHVAQVDLKPTMSSISGRSCLQFTAILLPQFFQCQHYRYMLPCLAYFWLSYFEGAHYIFGYKSKLCIMSIFFKAVLCLSTSQCCLLINQSFIFTWNSILLNVTCVFSSWETYVQDQKAGRLLFSEKFHYFGVYV